MRAVTASMVSASAPEKKSSGSRLANGHLLRREQFWPEEAMIHQPRPGFRDDRCERHVGQDVALDLDPRRDLGQQHALGRRPEDGALGDVLDALPPAEAVLR